jgi:hypothetical protein
MHRREKIMEDKIKVGEYIRNIWGDIYKYDYVGHPMFLGDEFYNRVVKHSKDIKDLLQIGDIIITNNLCGEITKIDGDTIYLANYMGTCNVEDIKSIVTKEQIKQIEFRIKE